MRRIRGMVVEDDERDARLIQQTLTLDFKNLCGWSVDWTVCGDALAAREEVQTSDPFDFAIIDLDLGKDRQNGLAVVEELHRKDGNARTFILVITGHPKEYPTFVSEAERAGATAAIIRSQLTVDSRNEWSFQNLARRIWEHLVVGDRQADSGLAFDDADPDTLAILQTLGGDPPEGSTERGRQILRRLAIACIEPQAEGAVTYRVSRLAQGRSGAHVCRIDVTGEGRSDQSYVLKVGLDRRALEHERTANATARKVLEETALVSVRGEVRGDESGYHAIVAKLADRAQTLAAWLVEDTTRPGQAEDVARIIFDERLRPLFQPGLRADRPAREWMSTSPLLRLRVHQTLSTMRDVVAHRDGANCRAVDKLWDLVRTFADTGTLPVRRPERLARDVRYVGAFGDLHSANVLVRRGVYPTPLLIDASGFGQRHWGWDSSRLLVDLFLRVRAARGPAMLWSDYVESAAPAARLCPLSLDPGFAARGSVESFIAQVLRGLPGFLQFEALGVDRATWHWQWHTALAKEFLRQGCHTDLTPPRRALALTSAARHLRFATRLVDAIEY